MENRTPDLVLLTNGFPYGNGEQFLETEILYLSESFRHIWLYPVSCEGASRKVPANVSIVNFSFKPPVSVKKLIAGNFFLIIKILFFEIFLADYRLKYWGKFKYYFHKLLGNLNEAENFLLELKKYNHRSTSVYSYWFGPWGSIMCLCNALSYNKIKFISRAHGYDYDINQRKEGFIPFRNFEMRHVEKILPVSQYAFQAIKKEFPFFKNLTRVRLGVNDNGENPVNSADEFHIVSCSSLIPLKRVHLIIRVLKELSFPVKWTHFGDGELRDIILGEAGKLPGNIRYEFKGFVPNAEIIQFYRTVPVDLFINLSELEGIPVSVMEAISFGIPSIGCNICGVPEIITPESGFLFEKNFEPGEISRKIDEYRQAAIDNKIRLRKSTKEFWRREFNAAINYRIAINELTL